MNKFVINDYITLKLENDKTNIYICGEFFSQCKFLLIDIPIEEVDYLGDMDSIDDIVDKLDKSLETNQSKFVIDPETEFWGHCSNLQAWTEHNYDTRLLHTNLSFPLLKKLSDVGDQTARQVFKEEVAKRIKTKSDSVINFILEEKYLDDFNREELEVIFEESFFFNATKEERFLNYLVSLYFKFGLWDYIIKGLTYVLDNNPQDANGLYYLGLAKFCKTNHLDSPFISEIQIYSSDYDFDIYNEDNEDAVKAIKKSLELNPHLIDAWRDISEIYKLRKERLNVINTYKKILEIDPNNKNAQYNLIDQYYNTKENKNLNLVQIIQYINSKKGLILFDYKCPQCRKINKTDFNKINICKYCGNILSKSGKFKEFNLRRTSVAGAYYPKFKEELINMIEKLFKNRKYGPGIIPEALTNQRTVIGGISPNAGYFYSGYATAHTFMNLFKEKIPDTIIILAPDLFGYGSIGIMGGGIWETPLGNISIDSELAIKLSNNYRNLIIDDSLFIDGLFARDHSIELQLPFIKYCSKDLELKFVPIIVPHNINYNNLDDLANQIAQVIDYSSKDIIILAVAAMSHKEITKKEDIDDLRFSDQRAIKSFEQFDPISTYSYLSMIPGNGLGTITTLMLICKKLRANKSEVLEYYTSQDIMKNTQHSHYCVGYFSGIISYNK